MGRGKKGENEKKAPSSGGGQEGETKASKMNQAQITEGPGAERQVRRSFVSEKVKSKTHLEGVMRGAESKKRPVSLELSLWRTIGSVIRRSGPSFNANVDSILDEVGIVEHTNSRCLPRLDSSLILAYYHFILKEVVFDPSLMKSISASKIKSAHTKNRFAERRVQSVSEAKSYLVKG